MEKVSGKIITAFIVLFSVISLFASPLTDPIAIGSISFKDAVWDKSYNIMYSRQKIQNLTAENKAVVLYFFEICFT